MSQENATSKQPLIRPINRQQMSWRAVDVERLIGEDHRARAIWALVGRLDLQRFYEDIESSAEQGGRPAFDPQLLISLWVYAYSEGIGSAREVARRCEFDPAFQWLTGLEEVNYHTLADFRVEKQQELDELFTQVLAAQGLIVGLAVTQAAEDSAQLLPAVDRIEERLKKTPQQIVADGGYTTRDNIEKMVKREIDFLGSLGREEMPSGVTAPKRLPPSAFVYQPEANRYVCPEGKLLRPQGRHNNKKRGLVIYLYEAKFSDCQPCIHKPECCPENQSHGRGVTRRVENAAVVAFREKMAREEAQEQYRRRGRVVEFCHAWIKSKLGLRQFHVRGLRKVLSELLWACLTSNPQQWIRLSRLATSSVAS